MSLSFKHCKHNNDKIADYFRKINSLAHEAEVYAERHGSTQGGHGRAKRREN